MAYFHLIVILLTTFVPDFIWGLPTLAAINVAMGLIFYWLCFELLTGLKISAVNVEIDTASALTSKLIQITGTILLWKSGGVYETIAYLSMPYLAISFVTDAFAFLVKKEILQIEVHEEPEE